eukprot:gnl/TRDRNA2_/TRDRNA2_173013_c4_seq1.p1 gnl/TRDRNA2_/TRDRNA2_173013_c4~~gnl/TRDRNA2_/TRDRNA2_173013_c4_seq1.p1  ORF type:complete len:1141 (-),score=427.86 gnl/TRDRNA2_/TRDRNA2_173013_c4_seq1:209-3562(-)
MDAMRGGVPALPLGGAPDGSPFSSHSSMSGHSCSMSYGQRSPMGMTSTTPMSHAMPQQVPAWPFQCGGAGDGFSMQQQAAYQQPSHQQHPFPMPLSPPHDAYCVSNSLPYGQQQQQQQQAWGQQGGMPQQQAATPSADGGVGNSPTLVVSGCTHATVAPIVRGTYTLSAENHGKPAYKKDQQVNGLDVMIYYWDDRDGPNFCGWWFGPKIGGDQVWAYHTNRNAMTPPPNGYKVPYDGPVDNSFLVAANKPAGAAAAPGGMKRPADQMMQGGQQGWGQQGGQMGGNQSFMQQQQQQNQMTQQQRQQQFQQQLQQQQALKQQQQAEQQARIKAQQEETMKRMQEANAKRIEEQKKKAEEAKQKLEEQKRKMEEQKKKAEEEAKKKAEEQKKRVAEQQAAAAIRRVMIQLKSCQPTTVDTIKKNLADVMEKELEKAGDQQAKVKEEVEEALKAVDERMKQIAEAKAKAEAKKVEDIANRKIKLEKCDELLGELETYVDSAETASKKVKDASEVFTASEKELTLSQIESAAKKLADVHEAAKEKVKACQEFVTKNNAEIREPPQVVGAPATPWENKNKLTTLQSKITTMSRTCDQQVISANAAKIKATKKASARSKVNTTLKVFKKYDKDGDSMLNKKELQAYAQGEYAGFKLPSAAAEQILKILAGEGKGVKGDNFRRVKVLVGIEREVARDNKRKAVREAQEKAVAEAKEALANKIKETTAKVDETDGVVKKAEEHVVPLASKARTLKATEMVTLAAEADGLIKTAKAEVAACKKKVAALSEDADEDLQAFLKGEVSKIESRLKGFDTRLNRVTGQANTFRESAKTKEATELEALKVKIVQLLKHHQTAKSLSNTAVFAEVAKKGDSIDQKKFVAFFQKCEKPDKPKPAKKPAPPKKEGDEEKKEEEPEPPAEKEEAPPDADLKRVFTFLDEDDEGKLTKDVFLRLIRVYMKVVKETVVTETLSIKESKVLRRLEIGEVVEVLGGEVKEEEAGVMRLEIKAMKDDVQGFVTPKGNQGTPYLKDGGNIFKVVKETILTDDFELGADKESTRKLKDTTRKLKVGELLEAREWPKKEEKTGLTRMKVKAKSDGASGWATTTGVASQADGATVAGQVYIVPV